LIALACPILGAASLDASQVFLLGLKEFLMIQSNRQLDHVVFAGGGTAGHLFPGLAVADQLRRWAPETRITFAGTGKAFESRQVRQARFEPLALRCRPFPRKASEALRFLAENVSGYYQARKFLRQQQASLVVGLGGYASVPAARAAASLGIPYVLLEQNAVPGRATRWLAPGAALVCLAMEDAAAGLSSGSRLRVTGNPLRREFLEGRASGMLPADRYPQSPTLVVLGGSGGAQTLNQQVPMALYKAGLAIRSWHVVHQTGERGLAATTTLYRKLGIKATTMPFIENLAGLLLRSRLAISRAGGTTLAELAATGVPSILLPYPQASGDHQRKNADVFAAAGAAQIVDQREVVGRLDNHLSRAVIELASDEARRVTMAAAVSRLACPNATRRVTKSIVALLSRAAFATS
jgi:UDP-N-acetylglucosamine--N-acetylmuramyl-(pentapeptide) pyrophosphoryl-undecaprenol N-acetylglucosamine transferase